MSNATIRLRLMYFKLSQKNNKYINNINVQYLMRYPFDCMYKYIVTLYLEPVTVVP